MSKRAANSIKEQDNAGELAELIKQLRIKTGVSCAEFARVAGYSQSHVSAIENNSKGQLPNKKALYKLSEAFEAFGHNKKEVIDEWFKVANYTTVPEPIDVLSTYSNEQLIKELERRGKIKKATGYTIN